ncbi:MAG: Smr/MutS family protein [Chloroflexota bacterium]|nr:Smr/MutS family protein [Chloroflexota bacterium]
MPAALNLDLHAFTVEEALIELDRYLYECYIANLFMVRIVHGKGTGALREAVRRELSKHPLVASFSSATSSEGGEGATIVLLRD